MSSTKNRSNNILDPIDAEVIAEGMPHVALITSVHRSFLAFHGIGGAVCLLLCVGIPVALSKSLELSLGALQWALVGAGVLLVALTALRFLSKAVASRYRKRVRAYCAQSEVTPEELVALSRRLGPRWFFFQAIWQDSDASAEA